MIDEVSFAAGETHRLWRCSPLRWWLPLGRAVVRCIWAAALRRSFEQRLMESRDPPQQAVVPLETVLQVTAIEYHAAGRQSRR